MVLLSVHQNILGDCFNRTVPTEISVEANNVVLVPHEPVTFLCNATSDDFTPIVYSWYFNDMDNPVMEGDAYEMEPPWVLVINTTDDLDGGIARCGTYICVASNGATAPTIVHELLAEERKRSYYFIKLQ